MIFLIFFLTVYAQNYCHRDSGVTITKQGECLSSSKYNVENCCVECLLINTNNQTSTLLCQSLYSLGYDSCSKNGIDEAKSNINGNIQTCLCLCNPGSNKTEVNNGIINNISMIHMVYLLLASTMII
jgi:hypothetical protein